MKNYVVLLLASLMLGVSAQQADYYWRNFNGDIPEDAFVAGRATDGKSIYIGQGLFTQPNLGLISGTIYEDHVNLTITAQLKVFTTDKNIKNFRWVPVTGYSDFSLLTNVHIVDGGVEGGNMLHIGRALHEGSTEIGKIYQLGPLRVLLNIPNNENKETAYDKFEILVYDFDYVNEYKIK